MTSHSHSTAPSLLLSLARNLREFESALLPDDICQQAKLLVLDSIGCALITQEEPEVRPALNALLALGGAPQATIIGTGVKSSVLQAVLANEILVRYLDLNDFTLSFSQAGLRIAGHPSDNIPVALAMGEAYGASGRDVLSAIVLGYDLFDRMRQLFDSSSQWDGTSASGLVAAAMSGVLMSLDETQLSEALALGAMRSATPRLVRRGHITAAKFLANPLIAHSGVLGALLAASGMTGPQAIFEDEDGLACLFRDNADLNLLAQPFNAPFAIEKAYVKAFPCLATGQAETAAAIQMHHVLGGRTDHIDHFDVIMADYPMVLEQQNDPARRHPDSREAADHSFYFLAAVGLIDGTLTTRSYDNERWLEPAIVNLMAKGHMRMDGKLNQQAPKSYPCAIEVTLKDGSQHRTQVDYAPGHSIGLLEESAVVEKFNRLTQSVLSHSRQEQIIRAVMSMDQMERIESLMALCSALDPKTSARP